MRSFVPRLMLCMLVAIISPTLNAAEPAPLSQQAEAQLAQSLRALGPADDTPENRLWLESLRDYQELSLKLDSEHRPTWVPRYGIQALAGSVLQRWDMERRIADFDADPTRVSKALNENSDLQARALWLSRLSQDELQAFRAQYGVLDLDESALRVLLERAPDLATALQLTNKAGAANSLRALAAHIPIMAANDYAQLRVVAAKNPALLSQLSHWDGERAQHDLVLLAQLDRALDDAPWTVQLIDTALIAGLPDLKNRLSARLHADQTDPDAAALAAYGLWRLGSADALAELQTYANKPDALAHLREEVQQWLD